jgi:predicted AAA+ superfamily ATPase
MVNSLELQKIIQSWREFADSENKSSIKRNVSLNFAKDLATALIGVRRCGKTTIAIQATAAVSKKFLYINFEDPFFSEFSSSSILENILEEYFNLYHEEPLYIIFDEIHNIEKWEKWARKFIDQKKGFLILTGSSAKMLSSELSTSLTGRNITKEIWPLSFGEYRSFLKIDKINLRSALLNYLQWGGFPRAVLEPNEKLRAEILKQYYSDATLKDVIKRNEIRDVNSLLAVFNYYLTNISSLHSYNSVKNAFGISIDSAISYTEALISAFLIFEVSLYNKNLKIQSRNPKKVYAIDTGFRNMNARSNAEDRGKLLENFVFLELKKQGKELYYHKNKFECDFIVTEKYKPLAVIQVCESLQQEDTKLRELKGLREAMLNYKLKEGLIITLNEDGKLEVPEGAIRVVSAWRYFC